MEHGFNQGESAAALGFYGFGIVAWEASLPRQQPGMGVDEFSDRLLGTHRISASAFAFAQRASSLTGSRGFIWMAGEGGGFGIQPIIAISSMSMR